MPTVLPTNRMIVVIDDDNPFLTMMQEILESEGYTTVTGSVVGNAMRVIRENHPALVILDLVMQTQTAGLDVFREMRADMVLAHTPVLFLTASAQFVSEQGAEMRKQGAEVLAKPFNLVELLSLIATLVGQRV